MTTACCRPTWSYAVVSREVVIPASTCCDGRIVAAEGRSSGIEVAAAKPSAEPTKVTTASGTTPATSVVKTAAVGR
ncbi:MAG: hypothetical protein EBZ59_00150 [Planctomycetia bacterium]|nr:hypothetical protein [Planctomycetia bacterium]